MGEGADTEIARLRARAYGPDADITADPAAVARLAELERAAQSGAPAVDSVAHPDAPAAGGRPTDPPPDHSLRARITPPAHARIEGSAHRRTDPTRGRRGTEGAGRLGRGHVIAVAVVAAAGLVLAAGAAVRTVTEAAPTMVLRVTGDPGASAFADDVSDPASPVFPIAEDMQWSAPVGVALGWDVWVGRSRSNFACIAVVRSTSVRADCVRPEDFDVSGATIYLPPGAVSPDQRPPGLVGQAVAAYRWWPDRSISVQVER